MPNNPDTLASMVQQLAKHGRRRGRPKKRPADVLSPGRFVRLDRTMDAVIEVHRRQLEKETGLPTDLSAAMRDLLARGAAVAGLLPDPSDNPDDR